MRLPSDAALLIADEPRPADAAAALLEAWREEALPVFRLLGGQRSADDAFADTDLEARLDAIGATTLVFAGASPKATVLAAAERGYRVFVVGELEANDFGGDVRIVSHETAMEAARRAKFRQRWAEARRGG
jgi:nicotinamidase-related amidase